jgi:hypothetical protein
MRGFNSGSERANTRLPMKPIARITKLICTAALTVGVSTITIAQTRKIEAQQPTIQQIQTQISILIDQIKDIRRNIHHQNSIDEINNERITDAYINAKLKEYEFNTDMYQINKDTFIQQRYASYVILLLVVIITLSGIWMSWYQLSNAAMPAERREINDGQKLTDSTVDISITNIKLTSSVVGVLILLISLSFFYLFIKEVYPISYVDSANVLSSKNTEALK